MIDKLIMTIILVLMVLFWKVTVVIGALVLVWLTVGIVVSYNEHNGT